MLVIFTNKTDKVGNIYQKQELFPRKFSRVNIIFHFVRLVITGYMTILGNFTKHFKKLARGLH